MSLDAPGILEVELVQSATTSYLEYFKSFLDENASVIVLTWFFFLLIRCVKLIKEIRAVHRISTVGLHHPSQSWLKKLGELRVKLGILNNVRLLESKHINVPMTLGYLKATIFVPIGLLANLPSDQVESILLHELAHIKRRDHIMNLMQSLAEIILFFNPAILWISSLIREEREACCDDMVVENLADKKSYLEALISFQEYAMGSGSYFMALTGRKNFLLTRVKRLLTHENKKLNLVEKSILLLSIFIITAFSFITNDSSEVKPRIVKNKNNIQRGGSKDFAKYGPDYQGTADTVPAKKIQKAKMTGQDYGFTQLRYNKTNDPREPVHIYEIMDSAANTFRITREKGQLVAISVNNRPIPSSQVANYQGLFESAERYIRERSAEKRKSAKDRMAKSESNKKSGDSVALRPQKKKHMTPDDNWAKNAARIKGVLEELVNEGVVPVTSSVEWFGINDHKMMVNGKEVSEELHRKIKSRYGIEKNSGLFYGPSEMHGPGVYFDKKDLN